MTRDKAFTVFLLLEEYGHMVLRLPPYGHMVLRLPLHG